MTESFKIGKVFAEQVKSFEKLLPSDKQVGIVIKNNLIAVKNIRFIYLTRQLEIEGILIRAVPPLVDGELVRFVLEPTLQGLTLTSVQYKDSEPRQKIGFDLTEYAQD